MHDAFISYSSKELAQAETVRNVLEKNGIPCWMAPRDIPGGSNYSKEIPIAIRECQVFVLLLSQNAQSSHWVLKELDAAVNNGKVILPFMLEDIQLNDEFNFLLTGAQRYAAYQKKTEAMETLIRRVRAITHPDPTQEVPVEKPVEAPVVLPKETGNSCPACGSREMTELKKRVKRVTSKEKLTLLLLPVAAVAGALVMLLVAAILGMFLSYTGAAVAAVFLPLLGIVAGPLVCSRIIDNQIRRKRVRSHIHPNPYCCSKCQKVFLLPAEEE